MAAQEAHEPRVLPSGLLQSLCHGELAPSSIPASRDESRDVLQHCSARPERRNRCVSLGDELVEPVLCRLDSEERNERRLASPGILGDRLTERLGIAFGIEQVIGELEGLAEGFSISKKRRSF